MKSDEGNEVALMHVSEKKKIRKAWNEALRVEGVCLPYVKVKEMR